MRRLPARIRPRFGVFSVSLRVHFVTQLEVRSYNHFERSRSESETARGRSAWRRL